MVLTTYRIQHQKTLTVSQLRYLKEYHVRPIGTEKTKIIDHDNVKLFWLVDKTTGYIEAWVNYHGQKSVAYKKL